MERMTEKQLQAIVDRINRMTGAPMTPYTKVGERHVAQIGNYHLSGAYGGKSLHRMVTDGGGISDVFGCGHASKRDLAESDVRLHSRAGTGRGTSEGGGMSAFDVMTAARDRLEVAVKSAAAVLNAFPKGPMGLTPDYVKRDAAYKIAADDFARAFAQLRNFNTVYVRQFRKEIQAARVRRMA